MVTDCSKTELATTSLHPKMESQNCSSYSTTEMWLVKLHYDNNYCKEHFNKGSCQHTVMQYTTVSGITRPSFTFNTYTYMIQALIIWHNIRWRIMLHYSWKPPFYLYNEEFKENTTVFIVVVQTANVYLCVTKSTFVCLHYVLQHTVTNVYDRPCF